MSQLLVSDDVAADFAQNHFCAWQQVSDFSEEKLKRIFGLGDDKIMNQAIRDRMHALLIGQYGNAMQLKTQNYMDVSMGARYLVAAQHPFPSSSSLSLVATPQELLLPIQAANFLKSMAASFVILNEEGLETKEGGKCVDDFFSSIKQIKSLIPSTSLEALSEIFPVDKMPTRPDIRKKIDEITLIALGDARAVTVINGKVCALH